MISKFTRLVYSLLILTLVYSCGDTNVSEEGFKEAKLSASFPITEILRTTTTIHTVTVKNIGDKIATGISVAFNDPNNYLTYDGGTFPGTGGTCTDTLTPKEECTIDFRFLPLLAGDFEVDFEVDYFNGATTSKFTGTMPLKGNTEALLEFEFAPSYDFGSHNAGVPSPAVIVRVTNTGETESTVMNGALNAPFEYFGGGGYPGFPFGTCSTNLPPGDVCSVQVFFNSPVTPVGNYIENIDISYFDGLIPVNGTLQLEATNQAFVNILSPLTATYINAANENPFTINGDCSLPGANVNVAVNAFSFTAVCQPDTTWTMSPNLGPVAEGAVTITATHSSATPDTINLTKDSIVPTPAPSAATWVQASPYNSRNVTASWTPSTDPDVVSQRLRFYSNSGCSAQVGADTVLAAGTSSFPYSAPTDGDFYYQIVALDDASNPAATPCSSLMRIDTVAPAAPTSLAWVQVSPQNTLPVTSTWTLSTSTDVTSQIVRYFTDNTCATPDGTVDTIGGGASTNNYAPVASAQYFYTVTAMDAATNATTSICSPVGILIDIDPPATPTGIGWSNSSPTNDSTVVANWTRSTSPDVATQVISFFSENTCTSVFGASVNLLLTDNSYSFTGADGIEYYYHITVTDLAGNVTDSACSSVLDVDLTPPANAVALGFVETSPLNSLTFNATWTPSTDLELTDQSIQLFDDNLCTSASGLPVSLGAAATTTSLSGADATEYSYQIISEDLAGNTSTSACSSSILLDTTPPIAANTLNWVQGAYHNNINITATWTPSSDTDLASQSITYYDDVLCSNVVQVSSTLASTSISNNAFVGVNGTTYYYQITTTDNATNATVSACSNPMTVDTVAPGAVTITNWTEGTPTANATVNANWTLSADTDIASLDITFYSDAACSLTTLGPVSKLSTAITHAYTPASDGTFYFNVRNIDLAGNSTLSICSTGIEVDTTPPAIAASLVWTQTSPFAGTSVNASWTPSTDVNLASQDIAFYTDPTCATISGVSANIGAGVSTQAFSGTNGQTYYYQIDSIDHVGNTALSACSAPMRLDTTPPVAAAALTWAETTPHNATAVNANWTISTSPDVADQTIIYYTDAACSIAEGTSQTIAAAAATHSFSGLDSNTYHFQITTRDTAGNTTLSGCSTAMAIDTSAPSAPTALAWVEGTIHNATVINAGWTLSASGDVASQDISFYQDNACVTPTGGSPISLTNAPTNQNVTGVDASNYFFDILVTDTAGNTTRSACSAGILIDTTDPAAATLLGWAEGAGSNVTNVNADWTLSASADLASQVITYYTNPTCTIAEGTSNPVSNVLSTDAFTGLDGTVYYYTITSIDNATNQTVSACSSSMRIDTTPPAIATSLVWNEITPHDNLNVTNTWVVSPDGDVANQTITYFTDAGCSVAQGTNATLAAGVNTHSFTGLDANSYYYNITSTDIANNSSVSACSPVMAIDITPPNTATALNWTQTSPHNANSVDANWTLSTSTDIANYEVQFYTDNTCTTTSGGATLVANNVTTQNFLGTDSTEYFFTVTAIDTADNRTPSTCSTGVLIDTSSPAAATGMGWAQTTPNNSTNVTASWTLSVATDINSQTITYYTDAACSGGVDSTAPLSNTAITHNFTGVDATDYYYTITTTDNATNATVSACSSIMSIDISAPAAPTAITWAETTPFNGVNITSTWTPSAALDIANQRITYFTDALCTVATGLPVLLGAAPSSDVFTGSTGNSYYFTVTAIDNANNETASVCSTIMTIDTDPPLASTLMAWAEGTASNAATVNANWTVSASTDKASQIINIYQSASCTGAAVETTALGAAAATHAFVGSVSNNSYSYTITTIDNATNPTVSACSSAIYIDTLPPGDASGLGWVEVSPVSAASINATWTISPDPGLASQDLQVYSDGTCTTPFGAPTTLGAAITTLTVPGVTDGNTYSYNITSTDLAGNFGTSPCSAVMAVDTTAPSGANTLAWTQAPLHNTLTVNATWTSSADGDEASELISIYENDAACSGATFATSSLAAGTGAFVFSTGSTGNSYYFSVTTTDIAGNPDVSTCSTLVEIDTTAPLAATALIWAETTPSSNLTVNANWTVSAAADLASQSIQFYSDGTCTTPSGGSIGPLGTGVNSQSFTGTNGTTYSFRVTSVDNATNPTVSACSATMLLDNAAPNAPVATNWLEGTINNATSVTARWTLGGSGDTASHRVEYFTDGACSASAGAPVAKSAVDTTDVFSGADGVTYFYNVYAIDNAGNETPSGCNTVGVLIDTTDPTNASGLGYAQLTPFSGATIDATWTAGGSGDAASQSIQYYADGTCTTPDGAAIALALPSTATHNRAVTDGSTYSYTITTVDNATNSVTSTCSSAITIDVSNPIAANTLAWVQSSPANTTSLNTTWVPSTSPDIATQTIEYFSDACTTSVLSTPLAAGVATHNFTAGTDGNTYFFRVTSTDTAGNATASICSPTSTTIDTTFPTTANTIAWVEATPYNSTAINASWVTGGSGDVANHRVEYYNDGTCAGSVASSNLVASGATGASFTGTNTTTHSFRVVTIDAAGNETNSGCSNLILIDTDAAANATTLAWAEGTNTNATTINATWTPSVSPDVADQVITVYTSATCGGGATETSASLADNINTYAFTSVVTNNSYTYTITTTDDAGNVSVSPCSSSIFSDTAPPADATLLGFVESDPHSGTAINASWTKSVDVDLASQAIRVYSDGTCTTPFAPVAPLNNLVQTYNITGVANTVTYSYTIESFDTGGNSAVSPCSGTITIDTTPPTGVSVLAWVESSPNAGLNVNANWTPSGSGDEASELISIYENDAACSGATYTTSSLPAGTGAFNFTTGTNGNSYSYTITTTDTAGNPHVSTCSTQILLDTTAPTVASTLVWVESNPSSALTVNASWTAGGSGDAASQSVQFYNDGTCSSADGAPTVLSAIATTTPHTGLNATTYSYIVTTTDTAGNSAPSICSAIISLDNAAPTAPVPTDFAEGTIHNATTITARWTLGGSADIANHRVAYFTDGGCTVSAGAPVVKTSTDTQDSFTGANGNTYYYTVTAIDNAGNETPSACNSNGIAIDTTTPADATNLVWTQTSPYNNTDIEADWDPSVAGDLADQQIEYFADGVCSISLGAAASIGAGATDNQTVAAVHGTTYSYEITSIDTAGNSITSACSSSIVVDTVAPTVVATASLNWVQSSPSDTTNVDSVWTPSVAGDVASEAVTYYTNAACNVGALGPFIVTASAGTHAFATGTTGNTYYYTVTSTDTAGNVAVSACATNSMAIDTTFPTAANTIAWADTSPHNSTATNATWILGGSGDVANHRVNFYDDGTCAGSVASSSTVAGGATTASFTGVNATTHSFRVITIDNAGNETPSVCSNAITIDTDAPTDATTLAWAQGTASNSSPVTATWVVSGSGDKASQSIDVYQSATCGGPVFETAALATTAINSYSFASAVSNNSYSFRITTVDNAGNSSTAPCSSSIFIDILPPADASALSWVESSPVSAASVNASWAISTDPDLASQTIQIYADGTCTAAFGPSVALGAAATTHGVAGVADANSYSYTIESFDSAGNSSLSGCSAALAIDTTAPTGANTLAWTEAPLHNTLTVNATWTSSADGDEASELISIYENDAACSGATFATSSLAAGTGAFVFSTGSTGNLYSYTITTTDGAGNPHLTACSGQVEIDTTAPAAASGLVWVETSPSSNLTVNASWTPSVAADLASQSVQFYSDGTCTTPDGGSVGPLGTGVTSQSFTGTNGTTYSFRVTSVDNATNPTVSACSTIILLDNAAPNAPVATNWLEGTINNATSVTARWTLGGSGDTASHRVEYFTDGACSASAGAPVAKSAVDTTDVFSGADGVTYFYNVYAIDNAGNETPSGCNTVGVLIDTTDPTNASGLGYAQLTPFSGATIDATWTAGGSGDAASQSIQYYADGTCTTPDGAAIALALPSTATHNRAVTDGSTYSYTITTVDNATNSVTSTCSSAITIDVSNPVAANTLAWTQSSPTGLTSLNTTWVASTSPDIATQTIEYFSDACTTSVLSTPLAAGVATHNFTAGTDGNTYFFRVTSTDTAGNATNSICSPTSITIDTTFPAAANTIAWAESSPFNSTSINATWVVGGAGDIANHRVEYYNDGTCSGSVASSSLVASGATTSGFTGTNTSTHSFRVVTIDTAGNETNSVCSNLILIDTDAAANATTLAWAEGTNTNASTINATWTPSVSADVADQVVTIYTSATCGGGVTETSASLADNINTYAFTSVVTNNSYTYTITTTDDAGNVSVSGCSAAIFSDIAPPADATSLGFVETNPHSGATLNASWVRSADPDLGSQSIQVYSDGTCTTPFGLPAALNNVVQTYNITGVANTNTYSYTITSTDTATNAATSGCSSAITIDTTAPTGATAMVWTEAPIHNALSVNATWTDSTDGDEASELISIYENDAACSGATFTTSSLAANTGAFNFTTGTTGNSYSYTITTTDNSGNAHVSACSGQVALDTANPTAASALGWVESSPANALTVNATWTAGGSGDAASQSIQFHDNGTCTSADGAPIALGPAVATQSFTGLTATTYSYIVTTTDNAGNSINSTCSSLIALDTDDPLAPVPTDFAEGTIHNATTITARWTLGGSADIANHRVAYFTDGGCTASAGATVLKTSTDTQDSFTGANGNTYYYTVTAIDNAGNETPSACNSNGIAIDTTTPADATNLVWTQTSPYNNTDIEADWDPSVAGDLADQQIEYFADGVCSISLGAAASIGAGATDNQTVTAVHGTTYSYEITSIDTAGNSITSACSSSIVVDTVAPTVVATASLNWVQSSPSDTTNVDSVWTPSVAGDVASEAVTYYTNAACNVGALGPFIVTASAGTHAFATGTTGNTYYYTVTSTDNAGNVAVSACATNSMTLDTTFPTAANTIAWSDTSPHNNTATSASWVIGGAGDIANHRVDFYNDGTCAGSVASSSTESAIATTASFTGTAATTHSFKVVTIDTAGNETPSVCSNAITIDVSPPLDATTLAWAQGTAANVSPVSATWVASTSGDVASQTINIYQDASCSAGLVSTVGLTDTDNTHSFAGAISNNSYTYTITTTDDAGNTNVSPCSTSIFIDINPPVNATNLAWLESSPVSASTINADWDVSLDADLASQTIQFHSDGTCTTPFGSSISLAAGITNQSLGSVTNSNSYSYTITSFDSAGNSQISGCSSAMVIDTVIPSGASGFAWAEAPIHNALSVTANWTSSADGDEASELISIYENDATCAGATFETSSLGAGTGTYNFTNGSTGNSYRFTIATADAAGNTHTTACSAPVALDTTAPVAANTLAWTEGTIANSLAVNATWTIGGSGDAASQSIQFHDNGTCTSADGAPIALGAAVATRSFTGLTNTTYSYIVTTTDTAGNATPSACSASIFLDTDNPLAPVPTDFAEGTIHNATTITARWTLGGSADIANHRVAYFTDAGCTASAGATVLKTSTDTQDSFTGANGNTYYYTVTAIDNAGNETPSACNSNGIEIDTVAPTSPTGLVWTQTSPYSGATVDSVWVPSVSGDTASQSIQYYADGTCTTTDGAAIGLASAATTTDNRATTDGSTYSYRVTTLDNAGNSTISGCSTAMTIDLSNPLAANTLAWVQATPASTTNLNTTWVASGSGDVASQTITYYTDACTTSVTSVVLATGVATHNFTSGLTGNTYRFDVLTTDTAGNTALSVCSPVGLEIDTDFPTAANTIAWAETSPSNTTAITATWVSGGAGDLANHRVEYYNDGACGTAIASTSLEAAITLSSNFTATTATTHSFRIVSIDDAGNETNSVCSNAITIDTDAPAAATAMAWTQGTASSTSPIDAVWTLSAAGDKASQVINIYSNGSCSTAITETAALANNITTYSFASAVSNNTYSYIIQTIDNAGNSTNSACSTAIYIDTLPPADAAALGWIQTSPFSGPSVTASWTPSTDPDLASQSLQFHSDGTCTSAFGGPVGVAAAITSQALPGVTNTNTYSYTVTSVDSAGNSSTSTCSSTITIDTDAPTGADTLAWTEGAFHTGLSVNATWNSSADGDEASEIINVYENDASCSGGVFATSSLAAGTGTYNLTTGSDGNLYSFTIRTLDGAGNPHTTACSAQIKLDTTLPTNASALGWTDSSPHNGTALTATWTVGGAADAASQNIQFHDDGTCTSATTLVTGVGAGVSTQAFTAVSGNTYSYAVITIDTAGNPNTSTCSSAIVIDSIAPTAPSGLGWFETSPHNALTITPQWTLSGSGDVVSQRIDYYLLGACAGGIVATEALAAGAINTTLSGASGNTYYYTVAATDSAGNETISSCVAAGMLIDIDPPLVATSIGWTTATPSTVLGVTSEWVPSASTDVASQEVTYYVDASCTTPEGTVDTGLGDAVTTNAFTGTSGNNYYYIVRTIDNASNFSDSACSSVMRVDGTPPTAATGLGWAETAPHDNVLITAVWTPSASSDALTQVVNWYVDNACVAGSPDSQSGTLGSAVTSEAYTANDGETIYYTITTADSAGNATTSGCVDAFSSGMLVDTTFPAAATFTGFGGTSGWVEESPHNTATLVPSWAPPGSDVATQTLRYWHNGTCAGAHNEEYTGLAAGATTHTGVGTVVDGGNYSYQIIIIDPAENTTTSACSGLMNANFGLPSNATALAWTEGAVNNTTSINATWTESGSPDTADQEVIIYLGSGCSGTANSFPALGVGSGSYSQAFTAAAGENIYSFEVITTDVADNTSTSGCSADIEVDTVAPGAPTMGAWTQGALSAVNPITANWTLPGDLDRTGVQLEVFDSLVDCNNPVATPVIGGNFSLGVSVLTQDFAGTTGTEYFYRVTTEDNAGNTSVSASCSAGSTIDTTFPVAATGLNWTEAPGPTNAVSINANWTVNETVNIAQQRITIYSDGACTTVVTDDTGLGVSDATYNYSTALLDGLSVYFKIRTTDTAGNTSDSGCTGTPLLVNTSPPGDPTGGTALNAAYTTDASPATSPSFAWTNPLPLIDWTVIEIGLGTTTAPTEVIADPATTWTSAGAVSTSLGITGLTLANISKCTTYYPKVRARDNAGNTSIIPHVFTDGFIWDPDAPTFAGAISLSTDQTRQRSPFADWTAIAATDNCTFAGYRVGLGTGNSIGTPATLEDLSSFVTLSTAQTTYRFTDTGQAGDFYLALGTNYYINVIAFDAAGNETLLSSAPWQVTNTAAAFPESISNTGVSEVGSTTIQSFTCNVPHGVNRLIAVSVTKDSANTASVVSVTAGSNNVPFTLQVGQDQAHNSGWRTRGEIWTLTDDLTTGIPNITEVPGSTSIPITVTWSAASSDKIATCEVFQGVDQATPVNATADNELAQNASDPDIDLTLAQGANTTSFVACHHGNPVGSMSITQGTNDALQQTVQGALIHTTNENVSAGETYNCVSDTSWRRVIMGININGD